MWLTRWDISPTFEQFFFPLLLKEWKRVLELVSIIQACSVHKLVRIIEDYCSINSRPIWLIEAWVFGDWSGHFCLSRKGKGGTLILSLILLSYSCTQTHVDLYRHANNVENLNALTSFNLHYIHVYIRLYKSICTVQKA